MNELQVFTHPAFGEIRTITEDGKIYFCAVDVARALGYVKPDSAIRTHCRYPHKARVPHPQSPEKTMEMVFLPEGDVYRMAARSTLDGAERFESWLFDEVVPSIMHTGSYTMQPKSTAEMFVMQAQINLEVEQRMNALEAASAKTEQKVAGMANILQASIVPAESWQDKTNDAISALVEENGYNHQKYRRSLYEQLERMARVDLTKRQTRLRNRMAAQGKTKTQQKEISKLFVIAQDQKLRFIFDAILREEQAKSIAAS